MSEPNDRSDSTDAVEDQDAEPASRPTGAATQDPLSDDQDSGPASEPQDD